MRGYWGWILGGAAIVSGLIGFVVPAAQSADVPGTAAANPPSTAPQPAPVGPRFAAPLTPPTVGPTLDPNLPGVKLAETAADAATEAQATIVSETIGTLAGAYLNQAYLSIGILADAVGKETYDDTEAQELLDVHLGLATMVDRQLQALAKAPGMEQEERETVAALIKIAEQIRLQGETLHAVWNGDEAKVAVWEKLREETGDALERYFGEEEAASQGTPR